MKAISNINPNISKLAHYHIIALLLILFTACTERNEIAPEAPKQPITLNIPGMPSVGVYSTATESECRIENLWVLEFNAGGTLVNSTLIDGTDITMNGQATQLLPELPFEPAINNKVVLIANSDIASGSVPSGVTYSNINDKFTLNNKKYYRGGEALPMYGEITNWPQNYTCEMIRSVAKVQVKIGPNVDLSNTFFIWNHPMFYPKLLFYDLGSGGMIRPAGGSAIGHPATSSFGTTNSFASGEFRLLQDTTVSERSKVLYIHEFPSATQGVLENSIMATKFDEERIALYFSFEEWQAFRLDFFDNETKQYIDIKRNHHYTFTINKINLSEQDNNNAEYFAPGSNIEYTLTVEDNDLNEIHSAGSYAIACGYYYNKIVSRTAEDTIIIPATEIDAAAISGDWLTIGKAQVILPPGVTTLYPGRNYNYASGTGITAFTPSTSTISPQEIKIKVNNTFTQGSLRFQYRFVGVEHVIKKGP